MDIANLIPTFGSTLHTLGAFVIALSVIVAVHEYGHYIVGRWCGIKADVFSLGFGPVLWSRPDKHGTVWQIAALPFGGFVKFMGDADASSTGVDGAIHEMDDETRRMTMHGAPLWARSLTVAAGPVFNFVLSILVFGALALYVGGIKEPVQVSSPKALPASYGVLQKGDVLLDVGGFTIETMGDVTKNHEALEQVATIPYLVVRDGAEITVDGPFPLPPMVGSVSMRSAAEAAGLQVDDVITAIDGERIYTFSQLQQIAINSEGRELALTVWRDGEELDFNFRTKKGIVETDDGFEERWLIGMGGGIPFEPAVGPLGLGEAASRGVTQTYGIISGTFGALKSMISGDIGRCGISGPVGIARASGATARMGLTNFIYFVAVISTAVGLLNLFPIPVLDGGHLVFHAYEAVSGRAPGDKALQILMIIGLTLVLSLMVFGLTNDFTCP